MNDPVLYSELEFSFARSSGPGGQNVNKVNSKVILRWNLLQSRGVTEDERQRLLMNLRTELTNDGTIIVSSDEYRDQPRNRESCIEKWKALLAEGLFEPKLRKKTKVKYSAVRKNAKAKKLHSEKKKMRKFRGE